MRHLSASGVTTAAKSSNGDNIPTKPSIPYISFLKDNRKEIVQKNPGLSQNEVFSAIGSAWKSVPLNIKNRYELAYKKEMKQYRDAMAKIPQEVKELAKEKRQIDRNDKKIKAFKKDLAELQKDKPVKVKSAYVLYMKDAVSGQFNAGNKLFTEKAKAWNNLSLEKKQAFEDLKEVENYRYEQSLMQWEQKIAEDGRDNEIQQLEKKIQCLELGIKSAEDMKKEKTQIKREMKACKDELSELKIDQPLKVRSAYILYMTEALSEQTKTGATMTNKDKFSAVSNIWKNLSQEKKQVYEKKKDVANSNFEQRLADWKEQIVQDGRADRIKQLKGSIHDLEAKLEFLESSSNV